MTDIAPISDIPAQASGDHGSPQDHPAAHREPQEQSPPTNFASIYPGAPPRPRVWPVKSEVADVIDRLEMALNMPVWLLVQDGGEPEGQEFGEESYNMLGDLVSCAFFRARHDDLKKGQPIALVIDSNGGKARPMYEMAMLLRRHCGGYRAIVPRHAKSAATLLTLGADEIIMNDHAELGPLDVQLYDPDKEERLSGLDEVQSLVRLQAFAMESVDRTMLMLLQRTRKKAKTLLPFVTDFVTKLTQPMFAGIDVVRYTQMSRALKVAEEYGKRLLVQKYQSKAENIAHCLVEDYPEHGFPIYPDELRAIGIKIAPLSDNLRPILEELSRVLAGENIVGKLLKVSP